MVGSELLDVQISTEDKICKNKSREHQKRKQSSLMYAFILRTCLNRLLCIIFSQPRIWRELGIMFAMLCHRKINSDNFSSSSAERSDSGEITLLTEAAIASSSEVQNFKCGSPNHIISIPASSGPPEKGFLSACEPLKTGSDKRETEDTAVYYRGQKRRICWSDLSFREVCCLCGAFVENAEQGIPRLIWLSTVLPSHVCTKHITRGDLRIIKCN